MRKSGEGDFSSRGAIFDEPDLDATQGRPSQLWNQNNNKLFSEFELQESKRTNEQNTGRNELTEREDPYQTGGLTMTDNINI